MRCLSCHNLSFDVVCKSCHNRLLMPSISKRKVGTLEAVSLFKYQNISPLILTKHTPIGFRVYMYFSKRHLKPFLDTFAQNIDESVTLVSIDERVKNGYSHTALLSHYIKNKKLLTSHGSLLAHNEISYAGKPLSFRLNNPRDFRYTGKKNIEVILIDDIITTGVTLQEAQMELRKHGVEVLFALTLADARD